MLKALDRADAESRVHVKTFSDGYLGHVIVVDR
jgi:hypothetical protein